MSVYVSVCQPAYVGPAVDIRVDVAEGPGLWHFLDVFGQPRTSDVAPVRGLVVDVIEKEYGGGAKKLPPDILNAFFAMLANPSSQAMELIHLTVQNIYCRKSMCSLGAAVEVMANLNSVELFSNGLQDGDVEVGGGATLIEMLLSVGCHGMLSCAVCASECMLPYHNVMSFEGDYRSLPCFVLY